MHNMLLVSSASLSNAINIPFSQSCLDQSRKFETESEVTWKFYVVGDVSTRGIRDVACCTANIFDGWSSSGLLMVYQWSTTECDIRKNFDTNEYPNIFVSKNLHEWMFEYIRMKNLTRTNVRINIRIENCTNIKMFSNIRPIFTL